MSVQHDSAGDACCAEEEEEEEEQQQQEGEGEQEEGGMQLAKLQRVSIYGQGADGDDSKWLDDRYRDVEHVKAELRRLKMLADMCSCAWPCMHMSVHLQLRHCMLLQQQANRPTNKQTDRQRNRQSDRQRNSQTNKQTDRQTNKQGSTYAFRRADEAASLPASPSG